MTIAAKNLALYAIEKDKISLLGSGLSGLGDLQRVFSPVVQTLPRMPDGFLARRRGSDRLPLPCVEVVPVDTVRSGAERACRDTIERHGARPDHGHITMENYR